MVSESTKDNRRPNNDNRRNHIKKPIISPWENGIVPGGSSTSLLGNFHHVQQNQCHHKTRFVKNRSRRTLLLPPRYLLEPIPLMSLPTTRTAFKLERFQHIWPSHHHSNHPVDRSPSNQRPEANHRKQHQLYQQCRPPKNSTESYHHGKKKLINEMHKPKGRHSRSRKTSNRYGVNKREKILGGKEHKNTTSIDNVKDNGKVDHFPAEALSCHICAIETFATKTDYVNHLNEYTHVTTAKEFHQRNDHLLKYLTSSAKLSAMRRKDRLMRVNNANDVKRRPALGNTAEQITLKNYLRVESCCGRNFKCWYDLHEHKLSLEHLRKFHQNIPKDKINNIFQLDAASVKGIDTLTELSKESIRQKKMSTDNIPFYDPSTPFGLHFIEKTAQYKCTVCKGQVVTSAVEHCRSQFHHDNVVDAVNKEEEQALHIQNKSCKDNHTTNSSEKIGEKDIFSSTSHSGLDLQSSPTTSAARTSLPSFFLEKSDQIINLGDVHQDDSDDITFLDEIAKESLIFFDADSSIIDVENPDVKDLPSEMATDIFDEEIEMDDFEEETEIEIFGQETEDEQQETEGIACTVSTTSHHCGMG